MTEEENLIEILKEYFNRPSLLHRNVLKMNNQKKLNDFRINHGDIILKETNEDESFFIFEIIKYKKFIKLYYYENSYDCSRNVYKKEFSVSDIVTPKTVKKIVYE